VKDSESARWIRGSQSELGIDVGVPLPLGAWPIDGGVNFALFSRHATKVTLLIYGVADAPEPSRTIELETATNRTGDIWHIWVPRLRVGDCYAYRVDGPYKPESGLRFNPNRVLIDPYAGALVGASGSDFAMARGYDPASPLKDLSFSGEDNGPRAARAAVTSHDFDWQSDRPLKHPWCETVIYETHVRGLTIHPSSGVAYPGTYAGVVEKIPYFKSLGITAVELLPVQEFNENETRSVNPLTGERLRNYWGYSPMAFFAPKQGYARGPRPGDQVNEFKEMVRELHKSGIEVILDVVFNHSAEGDELGPTLSFRGLENEIYYLLEDDRRRYRNYSGCGNTLNCNHPVLREFIIDCLGYWAIQMHVDGFRFDLASILGRDEEGRIASNAPLLERIAEDPILRDVKLIAEAWDAGGAYQVGTFPGRRWSEWNGRFRDDVRRFWRGDPGIAGEFASRLCGSADIYQRSGKEPLNSINFITCHDGFTLNDLVSYAHKHNQANGEGNRDGSEENFSANYGTEGESKNAATEAVRLRQMKNMIATLMLSRGVPMLLGGDEFRRTQGGNNNAYCQDNEISWYDWRLLEANRELFRFTAGMIAFRRDHPGLCEERFYTEEEVSWFNTAGAYPDWGAQDKALGCIIRSAESAGGNLVILANAGTETVEFRLTAASTGKKWQAAVNTGTNEALAGSVPGRWRLMPYSLVVLVESAGDSARISRSMAGAESLGR
jgi:isoamylase